MKQKEHLTKSCECSCHITKACKDCKSILPRRWCKVCGKIIKRTGNQSIFLFAKRNACSKQCSIDYRKEHRIGFFSSYRVDMIKKPAPIDND